MNILFSLWTLLPFLDMASTPSIFVHKPDPAKVAFIIVVLVLFLAFIGYLIWKSIRDKKES